MEIPPTPNRIKAEILNLQMASSGHRATPLLTAFRRPTSASGLVTTGAGGFQSFLTVFACLIPLAACWYLGNPCPSSTSSNPCLAPVLQFRSVELTHPDLVAGIVVIA